MVDEPEPQVYEVFFILNVPTSPFFMLMSEIKGFDETIKFEVLFEVILWTTNEGFPPVGILITENSISPDNPKLTDPILVTFMAGLP